MRYRFVLLITFASGAMPLWAVENPNVYSPVGSPTAVPSATRSGLTPSRPFDTTIGSDDIITGHVGGLRHFRGILPYSSSRSIDTTAFSPVDNFLRRSYDPIVHDRSPGISRPYYDPRRTVTSTLRADGSALFSPTITDEGQSDPYVPPMLAQTFDTQYRQRPLSLSSSEVERLMSMQMQLREELERERLTVEEDGSAIEDVRTGTLFFDDYLLTEELPPPESRPDIPADEPEDEHERERLPEEQVLELLREEHEEALREESPDWTSELLRPRPEPTDAEDAEQAEPSPEEAVSRAAEKAEVDALLSRYGDFERLSKARVAEYLAAAEGFLKEGKFYNAADAFALAAIWGPEDVRPFVGQAVSLFAAGEYMSSAYLLRQAIVKNPKVASAKIDVSALIGDRDVFENRLVEMATWQQRSGSSEMAFLIAYVLHHDGRERGAGQAIQFAAEKMSDDKAVQILRRVILPDTD